MWVDSICVPVALEHREARTIAITRMAQVYRSATKTVVLDGNLAQAAAHHYKTGLELLCSEWARRLWTLQEVILPGPANLLVCVEERLLPWNDVSNTTSLVQHELATFIMERARAVGLEITDPHLHKRLTPFETVFIAQFPDQNGAAARFLPVLEIWNPLERSIREHIREMLQVLDTHASPNFDCLLKMYNALHRRSASEKRDEYICISQLLGLDLATLPALPASMDVVAEHFPIADNIIFLPGPRVKRRGFRWCPSSFLSQEDVYVHSDISRAELTEHGIKIQKAALVSQRSIMFKTGTQFVLWEQEHPIGRFSLTKESFAEARHGRGMETRQILVRKPVFLLIYDPRQPNDTHKRTVRFVVVDVDNAQSSAATDLCATQAVYIFNYVLIRMHNDNPVPPSWSGTIDNIPVVYKAPSEWIVD